MWQNSALMRILENRRKLNWMMCFFTAGDGKAQSVQAISWRSWGFQEGDFFSPALCCFLSETFVLYYQGYSAWLFSCCACVFPAAYNFGCPQEEEKRFIKSMRREMIPIAQPMPEYPQPPMPLRFVTLLGTWYDSCISISSWAHGQLLYPDDLFLCSRSSKQPTIPASPQFTHKLSHKERQQAITNVQGSPMR